MSDRDVLGRPADEGAGEYEPPAIVVIGHLEDTAGITGGSNDVEGPVTSTPL